MKDIIKYNDFMAEGSDWSMFGKPTTNTDLGNDNYSNELKMVFSKIMAQFNPDNLTVRELNRIGSYRITYILGGAEITVVGSTKNGIFYGNNFFMNGDYIDSRNHDVIKLVADIGTYLYKKYQDKINTNQVMQDVDTSIQKYIK